MAKVKIELVAAPTGSKVWVDGVEQKVVRSIRLEHVAGKFPVLTLEHILTDPIVIEGDAEVVNMVLCPACGAESARKSREMLEEYRASNSPEDNPNAG